MEAIGNVRMICQSDYDVQNSDTIAKKCQLGGEGDDIKDHVSGTLRSREPERKMIK
jgi:hypothetical protein